MKNDLLTGIIIDEQSELSLFELSQACSSTTEWIVELVEEGILEAEGQDPGRWHFSGVSLTRVHRAMRLHQDLEINLAGVALALELLDEIAELRRQVNRQETGN